MFLKLPIKVKKKDGSTDVSEDRFPIEDILNYREWYNKDGEDLTVIYFKKYTRRSKIIATISVKDLDKKLETV